MLGRSTSPKDSNDQHHREGVHEFKLYSPLVFVHVEEISLNF